MGTLVEKNKSEEEARKDFFPENPHIITLVSYYPNKSLTNKVLVLDVDETMIHSFHQPAEVAKIHNLGIWNNPNYLPLRRVIRFFTIENVMKHAVPGAGIENNIILVFRPNLLEFLIFAFTYFKLIIIWSAGQPKYVRTAVRHIFRDIPAPHAILDSEMCSKDKYGDVAKPLQFVYDIFPNIASADNTLIIDDRDSNIGANPDNGILIPEYLPQPTISSLSTDDTALPRVRKWLEQPEVINSKNIRTIPKNKIFSLT